MSQMIERGAAAMQAKRRELINQPLERIWPDLMRAAIEAMPGWEPIDTAPDGQPVLIFIPSQHSHNVWIASEDEWGKTWFDPAGDRVCSHGEPTHWQPLPSPPAALKPEVQP